MTEGRCGRVAFPVNPEDGPRRGFSANGYRLGNVRISCTLVGPPMSPLS